MEKFFSNKLLLNGKTASQIYDGIKNLPIIDYHCHLSQKQIKEDKKYACIGELWLSGDHYKWRAMRICGVDEEYITGNTSYYEKFLEYAKIMPKLFGSPLYYWSHMELKNIFGIDIPLNESSARQVYEKANERLKELSVQSLLKSFKVEYIATTDNPVDDLTDHGTINGITVSPTFRPDEVFALECGYLNKLEKASGIKIDSLQALKNALANRLDFFVSKNCKISDCGFVDFFEIMGEQEASVIFDNRKSLSASERKKIIAHLLPFLAKEYKKRDIVMQLHFGTLRNVNDRMFEKLGADSGYDIIKSTVDTDKLAGFLNYLNNGNALPKTILYSLNPNDSCQLAAISGAFKNILVGAAWWFNDTVEGIKKQLLAISEYAVLGTNLGMLTDSRSFASYVRFDFFRRILADFIGGLVDKGEYDFAAALNLAKDISYYNAKKYFCTAT